MPNEPMIAVLAVIEALENLDVLYLIGGSLASTVHGMVRTTQDADLVAELRPEHAEPFALALGQSFYVDVEAIHDAIRRRSSFNVIHLETMFKVDIFVSRQRPFDHAQFARRTLQAMTNDLHRTAYVASAEDTVLSKLEWYRLGGEQSERQWRDVLGVLAVQADRLDVDYMRHWAIQLDIADLLEKALNEAPR